VPEPLRSTSPELPDGPLSAAAGGVAYSTANGSAAPLLQPAGSSGRAAAADGISSGGSGGLPPLPKAGSLKQSSSLKKSIKSFKKAFSIKDKDAGAGGSGRSSGGLLAGRPSSGRGSDAGSETGSVDVAGPPSAKRVRSSKLFASMSASMRRLSSDGGRRASTDSAADGIVAPSDGGAEALLAERSKGSETLKKWGDKLRRSFSLDRESAQPPAPRPEAAAAPAAQLATSAA
jgi:hypothetical protein